MKSLSIICSSQYPIDDLKYEIIKTSGLDKRIEFLTYINNGELSLTEVYNKGLKEAKNDIIVFLHNDISIETKGWGVKLLKLFEKHPDYSIIGVAGTKFLAKNCKWWEKREKMYGRVKHTHDNKSWLSAYSEDIGYNLEEVVIVDGLFFAIDRKRIECEFDESVKGFHFYDVSFCLQNYLKGVKIGVTTAIRINHNSIGETNNEWEVNRLIIEEKYKDKLPINIKKSGNKLNILIASLSFNNFTGSELYTFELAKGLINKGHNVTICSNIGNPLENIAKKLGIKLFSLQEPPGFKLGDGIWKLKSQQGEITSEKNTLYKLSDINFDVIHCNHKPVTEHILRLYPTIPVICTIHSEVISLEEPVISPQIKRYIAIRPEIKDFLIKKFNINEDIIDVIYNPIDTNRFKVKQTPKNSKKRILFVGTIDYLRRNAINDLIKTTKLNNEELWLVGKFNGLKETDIELDTHVKLIRPTFNVEKYIQECDETAGILLGRTTIEGWLCGKDGWIYDVDNSGQIISKKLHQVPIDLNKFKSEVVVNDIINEYKSILD